MLNKQLLDEDITASGYKIDYLCGILGISRQGFIKKRSGEIRFSLEDIKKLSVPLHWDMKRIGQIFFDEKV